MNMVQREQELMAAPVAVAVLDPLAPVVRRAQRGDAAAFEQVYRQAHGRVFALCLRMSADRRRAEELTQDVFVRAWQKLDSFRGSSQFTTWLHRLAVNVVLSALRREALQQGRSEPLDEVPEMPCTRSRNGAVRLDLEAALAKLPAGARTVFVLHDVEGYRHDEIAELCGVAVGTSKAQLHRARRLLQEMMQ